LLLRLLLTRGHATGPFRGREKIERLKHDPTPVIANSPRITRTSVDGARGVLAA